MRVGVGITLLCIAAGSLASAAQLCTLDEKNACRDYSTATHCDTTNYCKAEVWSQPANNNTKLCQMCLDDIENLEKFVSAKTTKAFVKYDLLAMCRLCPFTSERDECEKLINDNFDKIYQDVVDKLNATVICRALYLCHSSDFQDVASEVIMNKIRDGLGPLIPQLPFKENICHSERKCESYSTAKKCGILPTCKTYVWSSPSKVGDDTVCDMCKDEVQKLHDWVAQEKTKEEIKKDLLMFCDSIPLSALQQECHDLVANDFDVIYNDIVAELDASVICTALGLCKTSYDQELSQKSCELDSNNACYDYSTARNCKTLNYCRAVVWVEPVEDNNICDTCMKDIDNIQKFLDSNSTREFVQAELLAMCKLLPWQQWRYQCQTTVLKNFEMIYDDITSLLNSTIICRALWLCHSQDKTETIPKTILEAQNSGTRPFLTSYTCSTLDSLNACRDYGTAGKCGRLPQCKERVWSGPTQNGEIVCDFCKTEMARLQEWVKKNATEAEIKKDLYAFCKQIIFTAFRDECNRLVEESFDSIYDDIIAMLDPDTICSAMGLCNQLSVDQYIEGMVDKLPGLLQKALKDNRLPMAATFKPSQIRQESCSDCGSFVHNLQNAVLSNKKVLNEWMTMLKSKCQTMDNTLLCEEHIDMIFYQTITLHRASGEMNAQPVCKAMNMCSAFQLQENEDVCDTCKIFFKEWQDEMKNNPNIIDELAKDAAEVYCLQKPKFKEMCVRYVSMVVKVMIAEVENEDVGKICARIQLCDYDQIPVKDFRSFAKKVSKLILDSLPKLKQRVGGDVCTDCQNFVTDIQTEIANNSTIVQDMVKLVIAQCRGLGEELSQVCVDYVEDNYENILKQFNSYDVGTICKAIRMCGQKIKKVGGDICTDCVSFVGDWKSIIANNQSFLDDDLKAMKKAICEGVPFLLRFECDKVFDEESAKIIEAITDTESKVICTDLYFCKPKEENTAPAVVEAVMIEPAKEKVEYPVTCEVCKEVMEYVDSMIDFNSTEREIMDALDSACSRLPKRATQCRKFVDTYGKKIVDLILKFATSPNLVCEALRLCRAKYPVACEVCKEVMEYVDSMIDFNSTEREILDALDSACSRLPKRASQCRKFVDTYGKRIVDLILKYGTSPSLVCEALQLCEADIACEACKAIMEYVDSMINFNSTEQEILDALDSACSHIPKYGSDCRHFVDTYGKRIVDLILKFGTSPKLVCEALMLCKQKEDLSVQAKSPITCELCEEVMKYVDSLIDFNSTEQEILNALDSACSHLPKYGSECRSFVDKYGKRIVELILKFETNPTLVCEALMLCGSKQNFQLQVKNVKGEVDCDLCLAIFTEIDKMLENNATEDEIMEALEKVCSYMGKYEDKCNTIIHEYLPTIIELIAQDLSPNEICTVIKLCANSEEKVVKKVERVKSDSSCDTCKLIAEELDSMLKETSTRAEIEAALKMVCSVVPNDVRDECDQLIDEYWPMILEFLVEELAPGKICVQLHLCQKPTEVSVSTCEVCQNVAGALDDLLKDNATQAEIEAALKEVCGILPSKYKDECNLLVSQYWDTMLSILIEEMNPKVICVDLRLCPRKGIKKVPSDDTPCETCQLIAGKLHDMLDDSATQKEIESALQQVCQFLPEQYKSQCDAMIEQYFSMIVDILVNELDPSIICSQLGLCPPSKVMKKASGDRVCQICEEIAQELHDLLALNSTQAAIEKALEEVCSLLPKADRQMCDDIIVQFYQEFMKVLVKELEPSVICSDLKLCPKKMERKKVIDPATDCAMCDVVMEVLKNLLSDKSTEAEIVKAVNSVCDIVPREYRDSCHRYVNVYGFDIIKIIVDDFVPDQVCVMIHGCNDDSKNEIKLPPMKIYLNKDDEECAVCKRVIEVIDELLKDNHTQAALEKALEQVCDYFPVALRDQCDTMIEEYAPIIFQYIDQIGDSSFICQHLKLCPNDVSSNILGGDKCTYGPSYWCRDMEAAKACGAVQHCRDHVWE